MSKAKSKGCLWVLAIPVAAYALLFVRFSLSPALVAEINDVKCYRPKDPAAGRSNYANDYNLYYCLRMNYPLGSPMEAVGQELRLNGYKGTDVHENEVSYVWYVREPFLSPATSWFRVHYLIEEDTKVVRFIMPVGRGWGEELIRDGLLDQADLLVPANEPELHPWRTRGRTEP